MDNPHETHVETDRSVSAAKYAAPILELAISMIFVNLGSSAVASLRDSACSRLPLHPDIDAEGIAHTDVRLAQLALEQFDRSAELAACGRTQLRGWR